MCEAIIRPKLTRDRDAIATIANCLPEWFTQSARRKIPVDVGFQEGFVAEQDGRVLGFILYLVWEGIGHISWLGVHPDYHRRGIGRRLLEHTEALLSEGGVVRLEVETVRESVDYEPYERTRAFYQAAGYKPFRREECSESLHLRKDL